MIAPSDATSTVKVSREHRVSVEAEGLVRVSGGKYTTYRVMARDAVDAVLGTDDARRRPSATGGAADHRRRAPADLDALAARLADRSGLDDEAARTLVDRHGTEAEAVIAVGGAGERPRPLVDGFPYLEAEVAWAVEHELAQTLDDVLVRRIRLAPELRDRGASIAPRVAAIMAPLLGWDDARCAAEVATYLEGAHREFDVPS